MDSPLVNLAETNMQGCLKASLSCAACDGYITPKGALIALIAPRLWYSTKDLRLAHPGVVPAPQWHGFEPHTAAQTRKVSAHLPVDS